MPRTLKYPPREILLWVARNYLSSEEYLKFINDIAKSPPGEVRFLNKYRNYIDIERFRQNPVVWQDIWIYNYIIYNFPVKKKFNRMDKLLIRYENEILIPTEKSFLELKNSLKY